MVAAAPGIGAQDLEEVRGLRGHWDPTVQFGQGLPRTAEQLRAGVVPPGFVSRLPDPWPGPATAPPPQPRPPLKEMLAGLAEFSVAYSLFRIQRNRDN